MFGELEDEESSDSNQPIVARNPSLESQGLDLFGALEDEELSPSNQPIVASTPSLHSQGLDLFGELEDEESSDSNQPIVARTPSLESQGLDLFGELEDEESSDSNFSILGNDEALNVTNELFQNLLSEDESEAGFLVSENSEELTLETPDLGEQPVTTPPLSPATTQSKLEPSNVAPEDFYIQASPEENLLPIESLEEEDFDSSLNLDSDILEQLESDLYSLEGLENTSPRSSSRSTTVNSGFLANADANTANPFPEMAEAELGTLEDLFPDILEESSEDEIFTLQEDLDSDLLTQEEEANVSLDDILASLTQTQENPLNSANPASETTRMRSNPPKSQKKT
ncbi:MAG: hypothetical protein EA000_14440 [Oscillatoriales cyanobacterium]|nr:MAG: hypothetical protein EA000_14440 [Oscillatoriales cyanobacterium]